MLLFRIPVKLISSSAWDGKYFAWEIESDSLRPLVVGYFRCLCKLLAYILVNTHLIDTS